MRISILSIFLIFAFTFAGVQDGITGYSALTRPQNTEEASRSSADWYGVKSINGTDNTGVLILTTTIGNDNAVVKAIYNNTASATTVRLAANTSPTDTMKMTIEAYSCSPKLPGVKLIDSLYTTDTLLLFYQVTR
jgi:hypothetical protein